MDKSKETPNAQNPISQTPRRLVRKIQKPQNLSIATKEVEETQTLQKSNIGIEKAKETQKPQNPITIMEDAKVVQTPKDPATITEEIDKSQKPQITQTLKIEDSKKNKVRAPFNIDSKYEEKIPALIVQLPIPEVKDKPDSVLEKRKAQFKPKVLSRADAKSFRKVKGISKVINFRQTQLADQNYSASNSQDLVPFTKLNVTQPCKSIPLYQTKNSSEVNHVLSLNELHSRISFLEQQLSNLIACSKTSGLSEFFSHSNSANTSGPNFTDNSNKHNYNLFDESNNSRNFHLNNSRKQPYSNTKENYNNLNRQNDNKPTFNYSRKDYTYSSINNKHYNNKQRYNIILTLNDYFFDKLRKLLYKLKEGLLYEELSASTGIIIIKVWLSNKRNFNIIKQRARKWIIYRKKEPVNKYEAMKDELKSPANMNKTEQNSKSNLSLQQWRTLKCVGDGNCLFRAISNQVYGKQSFHPKVRNEIVKYIQSERSHFENDITKEQTTFEDYIEAIQKPSSWGGNTVLIAASELYSKQIFIYNYIKNDLYYRQIQSINENAAGLNGVMRLLYSSNHFDVIVKKTPRLKAFNNFSLDKNFQQSIKKIDSGPTKNQ